MFLDNYVKYVQCGARVPGAVVSCFLLFDSLMRVLSDGSAPVGDPQVGQCFCWGSEWQQMREPSGGYVSLANWQHRT